MSNEIVKYENGLVSFPRCRLSKTALEIDNLVSVDEFLNIWSQLKKLKGVLPWWVGDAYLFSEANKFLVFDTAMVEVQKDYKKGTTRNCVFVCRKIQPSRRRERLSFGHHQAVAPLEQKDQDYYLDVAEQFNYSVMALRKLIKEDTLSKKDPLNCEDMEFARAKSAYLARCKQDMQKLNVKIRNLLTWKSIYRHYLFEFRPDIYMRNEILELTEHLSKLVEIEEGKETVLDFEAQPN